MNEALWIENGGGAPKAHLARIVGRKRSRREIILVNENRGRLVVPAAELTDPKPLTTAEVREYDRLDAKLACTYGEQRTLTRFNALRLRALAYGEE